MSGVRRTDLAVLEAFRARCAPPGAAQNSGLPFAARHGFVLVGALVLAVCIGDAQAGPGTPSIAATILKWTPLLARGFALNIAMSVLAMAIGTVLGMALGLGLISLTRPLRALSWLITQRLPLSDSFQERQRILKMCNGRYYTCEPRNTIMAFHRRLIDSGLTDAH